MQITDSDIEYAEKILLSDGHNFDEERRAFIKNMQTIDLQAVPGSGKTTALLAKLLILETKLPLENGSGILVLSHTNVAIDEIKHRILKYCPKLFTYPNFVGTIQGFVNTFLALPYFSNHYKSKITRLDNEIYDEVALRKYYSFIDEENRASKWLKNMNDPKEYFLNLRFDNDFNLVKGTNGKICLQNKSEESSPSYKYFKEIKLNILASGFLHFDDAYLLANRALVSTSLEKVLQKRFLYVFIDEMQDMGRHQVDLIEKLFYQDKCNCILQRIGDINQSIYSSGRIQSGCVWQPRGELLTLTKSFRLNPNTANIVDKFNLYTEDLKIEGKNTSSHLKPHILCYNDTTIHEVIPRFSRLVKEYKDSSKLPNINTKPIKAIAWSTEWKDYEDSRSNINKLRLEDFYTSYNKNTSRPKIDYQCLKEYLIYYDKRKQTLEPIRKNILNALIKMLRMENVKDNDNRFYTKRKLINYLRDEHSAFYDDFKLKVYKWCLGIVRGDVDEVLDDIRVFVPRLLTLFKMTALNSRSFMENNTVQNQPIYLDESFENSNFYNKDGFPIEVTSVHSVKGQTHCATLYLESFNYDYETNKLKKVFLGADIDSTKSRQLEACKMMYVGFSRPMDLLCLAIHKDRLEPMRDRLLEEWEILDIFDKDENNITCNI